MARLSIIVLFASLTLTIGSADLRASQKERDEASKFWVPDTVHTMHLRVTPAQWQLMQPTRSRQGARAMVVASAMPGPSTQPSTRPVLATRPAAADDVDDEKIHEEGERLAPNFYGYQFAYVKAQFECDGARLTDVGLKFRGNSSYNWAQSRYDRPFKLSFQHFVDGRKFRGISEFYLNNNAYDPSLMRETLGYETFRQLGVPAPRTTYALVYLTVEGKVERELLGLYTLIEDVDSKAFLKENFGSSKGFLMKPWSMRGFPYMGEQWEAYARNYNPCTDPTPETARRTIEFIKLVNYADDATFAAKIDSFLDVDQFLRWVAGHVILSSMDNILYTGHNFYLYLSPHDNRFHLMPWDLNLAYANFTSVGTADQLVHLSMMHPHSGETKIVDRLLAMPRYAQAYRNIIKKHIDQHFNPGELFPRVDALQKVVARLDEAEDAAWKAKYLKFVAATRPATLPATGPATAPSTRAIEIPTRSKTERKGWREGEAIPLKTFITRRIEALNAQFAGETDGFVPVRRMPPTLAGGIRAPASFGSLPMIASAILRKGDPNFDGKLTRGEFIGNIRAFFAEADAPRQDALDHAKLTAALSRALQQVQVSSSRRIGGGGFGAGGRDWRGGNPYSGRPGDWAPFWASAILRAADTGRTGKVTLDQLLAAGERAFAQVDKDKTGKLDDVMLLELLDAVAAPAPPATQPAPAASQPAASRPVQPVTQPATQPAAPIRPVQPATQPATQPAAPIRPVQPATQPATAIRPVQTATQPAAAPATRPAMAPVTPTTTRPVPPATRAALPVTRPVGAETRPALPGTRPAH